MGEYGPSRPYPPLPLAGGVGGGPVDKAYARPTSRARALRQNATVAERALWHALSARKVAGTRSNRQVPIGPYICDFVARSIGLVIEVDGGQHAVETERDARRTAYLQANGFEVIRFWNHEVLGSLDGVVAAIERHVVDRPSPNPSRMREGRR